MGYKKSESDMPGIQEDLDNLKDDLASLREDLGELVRSFISAGRSRVGDVRQRMEGEIRGRIDRLRSRQGEAMGSMQRQFQTHPMIAVSAAFGLGLVLGIMMQRGE
jgi:ElaB/YqjD/DUF883 family membrane-anchored ribosome-binding protein